jgi:GNAT superfamily N-acetyltransferase
MTIEIILEELDHLPEHGKISIAFEVRSVLELTVADQGLGGFILRERALTSPYVKDYDNIGASRPDNWSQCFDITNWALHSAWIDGRRTGGLVTAFNTQGLDMLERREDLAVIWDLRVTPELRGRGLGSALFAAAEGWAKARNCRQLKVETQNINVNACRFYARQGCTLGGMHRFGYPLLPEEVQLLWYKEIC